MNKTKPDKTSAWKIEAIPPPVEELCQLMSVGRTRFRYPQEGALRAATHAPGDGSTPSTDRMHQLDSEDTKFEKEKSWNAIISTWQLLGKGKWKIGRKKGMIFEFGSKNASNPSSSLPHQNHT